jgi:hypothetical protein
MPRDSKKGSSRCLRRIERGMVGLRSRGLRRVRLTPSFERSREKETERVCARCCSGFTRAICCCCCCWMRKGVAEKRIQSLRETGTRGRVAVFDGGEGRSTMAAFESASAPAPLLHSRATSPRSHTHTHTHTARASLFQQLVRRARGSPTSNAPRTTTGEAHRPVQTSKTGLSRPPPLEHLHERQRPMVPTAFRPSIPY